MEVNNISGLPLFQVSSSNEVFINRGSLTSGTTTATASFAHFTGSFQGDGSQLTNLNTTTPTLQQVTTAGATTTNDIQITGSLEILPTTNVPVKIYGSGANTIVGFGDNSTRFFFGSSGLATMVGFKMYSGILAGALDGGSQVINKLDRLELGGYGFGGTSVIGMISPAGTVTAVSYTHLTLPTKRIV